MGSLWVCSSVLPSCSYRRAVPPWAVRPLREHLGSRLWLELEPWSFPSAWWRWGDSAPCLVWVRTQPPHCATEGHCAPTCCVLSSVIYFTAVSCNQPLHPNTPNGSNFPIPLLAVHKLPSLAFSLGGPFLQLLETKYFEWSVNSQCHFFPGLQTKLSKIKVSNAILTRQNVLISSRPHFKNQSFKLNVQSLKNLRQKSYTCMVSDTRSTDILGDVYDFFLSIESLSVSTFGNPVACECN